MKFAVCTECLDWVKLRYEDRTCACGKSGGHYLADGLHAVIWGSCFAVGVDNSALLTAITRRRDRKICGEWWIIEAGVAGSHVEHFKTKSLKGRVQCTR